MRHNLLVYFIVCLLALLLSACDDHNSDADSQAKPQMPVPSQPDSMSVADGQQVSLLSGYLKFVLPAGMADQSGKLGNQDNNMQVFSSASGEDVIIVIISEEAHDTLDNMASRLEARQRERDPQLQVISSSGIHISGHPLWRFDSLIQMKDQLFYSSVLFGGLNDKLVTLQVMLPDDGDHAHQRVQKKVNEFINTIVLASPSVSAAH